jgi:hypothetical protein
LEMRLYSSAAELQRHRMEPEPWVDLLRDAVGSSADGIEKIYTQDLFDKLGVLPDRQTSSQAKRIAGAMRQLGWEGPKLIRVGSKTARGFTRRASTAAPKPSPFAVLQGGADGTSG